MRMWATILRVGVAVAFLVSAVSLSTAADPTDKTPPPRPAKLTPTQWRETAEKAEKAGDWETAFNAYCHLYVAERPTPELREKLNNSLRRTQQIRRHREAGFKQFASDMEFSGGLDLFAEVIQKVPAVYADRDKATPQQLWVHAVEELARALGNPAFRQAFLDNPRAEKIKEFRTALRTTWAKQRVTDHTQAREALRKLIYKAQQDYFAVRVPAALAIECACGACSGLDEYTVFLTPNQLTQSSVVPDLSAAGIYLNYANNGLVIEGIAPLSWAAMNVPLRRGDRIVKLNGRPMDNTNLATAAAALKNPINGFHELELPPVGEIPGPIIRIPALVPTVFGVQQLHAKEIGYLRIGSFQSTTPQELDEAIVTLKTEGAQVIIIDLRGNHGGSFLAGVETARRLIPSGVIVSTQGQVSEVANQTFSSASGMSAHNIKVVLLIDVETASAAEVLAEALKHHKRATLVGMPSFGKGMVQYPLPLVSLDDDPTGKRPSKTGAVRVTIAKLIAPSGGPINGVGVTPHVVEADPNAQLELAIEKALEELRGSSMMDPPSEFPMFP
ncbi:MAG: S41 family peptidase [Planctomycetia bacterium]|nr:S41 family peptidase [Planctomycetia bacterium]